MNCPHIEPALHRYRATLWPDRIEAADAEEHAARTAHALSGQRVLEVVRLEDARVAA